MSLADKVIEANEKQEECHDIDELGLGITGTPDYVVARILYRNTLEMERDSSSGLIHTRKHGTQLWRGNRELEKSKKTIYELANLGRRLKDYEIDIIWESLLRNTPELDENKIAIDNYTYWDMEKGELRSTTERMINI